MSEKRTISLEKTREMQERIKERNLIIQQIKNHGPSTVEELHKVTFIEKSKLLKHLIAMTQFGKVSIVGERDSQLVYALPEETRR